MNELGYFYKEIRRNKGLTQNQVCEGIVSRTVLSKFENGKLNVSHSIFILLLDRIDITFEEFLYISNNYEQTEKQTIISTFFSQFINQNRDLLKKLEKDCCRFEETNTSQTISMLRKIIQSQIELEKNTKEKITCLPKVHVVDIWDHVQNKSQWYFDEIRIISCCLFLFPCDTAYQISLQLLQGLEKYEKMLNTSSLKCAIYLNLSLMLIENETKDEAIPFLEKAIQLSKAMKRGNYLALSLARYGISIHSEEYIKKGLAISELFEDESLTTLIKNEVSHHTNFDYVL